MAASALNEALAAAWAEALAFWEEQPLLSFPVSEARGGAVACIDLATRQVFVDGDFLRKKGLEHTLPGLLAHELGHHLRHPHTLRLAAELHLLGGELIPSFDYRYLNIFFDLLINEHAGRHPPFRAHFLDLYAKLCGDADSDLFKLYMAIYEALWDCEGRILRVWVPDALRGRARLFAQLFFGLSDVYEQLVYFCGAFFDIFLDEDAARRALDAFPLGDLDAPDAADFPRDLGLPARARRAIAKGAAEGWIPREQQSSAANTGDPFARLRKLAGMRRSDAPAQAEFLQALAERVYADQVERILETLPLPRAEATAEPTLPTVLEEWESGDDPGRIDWLGSVMARGALAAAMPLARELVADDQDGDERGVPRLEIYLDTSGSMPDPRTGLNCMTLAALVLATLAVRKGAPVRGVIYSQGPCLRSDWMRSEAGARRFFLQYVGGGTDFPFAVYAENVAAERRGIRIIISDRDFVWNLAHLPAKAKPAFAAATARAERTVLFLAQVAEADLVKALPVPLGKRLQLVSVPSLDEFGKMSALLARALLGE